MSYCKPSKFLLIYPIGLIFLRRRFVIYSFKFNAISLFSSLLSGIIAVTQSKLFFVIHYKWINNPGKQAENVFANSYPHMQMKLHGVRIQNSPKRKAIWIYSWNLKALLLFYIIYCHAQLLSLDLIYRYLMQSCIEITRFRRENTVKINSIIRESSLEIHYYIHKIHFSPAMQASNYVNRK